MFGATEIRWRRLRNSLALCSAAALAGGAAAAAAWRYEHRIEEGLAVAESRLVEARRRYSALTGEREEWRRFGVRYRRLAEQGRLGEERPAHWTEAVRSAGEGVPAVRHRLGEPHVVEREGRVEVRATDMSIDLDLRHEAELPVFLAALEREASGLFTVPGCRLVRADRTMAREPPSVPAPDPAPAVEASCRIRWQSVVLSGVEPGWTPAAGPEEADDASLGPAAPGSGPAVPSREAFGRLFTTVAERAEIDSASSAPAARPEATDADALPSEPTVRPGSSPRPSRWVRVGGVVARSGRSVYAWIDGRRVAYGRASPEAPAAAGAEPPGPPGVRLGAGGHSVVVRPGQRFDPHSGAVSDPIRRPRERLARDRSLRKSSRAPLTDLPRPGQN